MCFSIMDITIQYCLFFSIDFCAIVLDRFISLNNLCMLVEAFYGYGPYGIETFSFELIFQSYHGQ